MKSAKGDFIIFLDDDDWYLPNAISEIRKVCALAPERLHSFGVQGHTGIVKAIAMVGENILLPMGNGMVAIPNIKENLALFEEDVHEDGEGSDWEMIRNTIYNMKSLPIHHLILTYAEGGIRGGG